MATQKYYPRGTEESLIVGALGLTYPLFFIGALYISGSVIGWLLLSVVALRMYLGVHGKHAHISMMAWLWVVAMLVMLLALLVAHADFELGMAKTIKSSIGWAKGWALLALFIVLGGLTEVRPELITRAMCRLAMWSGVFSVVTLVISFSGLSGDLFVSPFKVVGGPGESFFTVSLYGMNPETGGARWRFFTPWAPAAGFMGCLMAVFALQEQDPYFRRRALLGSILVVLLSQSRAGWAILLVILPLARYSHILVRPLPLMLIGALMATVLLFGQPVFEWVMQSYADVKASRPESTRVREALANIAIQRWQLEAPVWGHGIVEAGPRVVKSMPIGSHHSWYGLLFVKGAVGLVALLIPMLFSFAYLLILSPYSQHARSAMCFMLILICYSFFENLEILAYLYWPALIWIGMAFNPCKTGVDYDQIP